MTEPDWDDEKAPGTEQISAFLTADETTELMKHISFVVSNDPLRRPGSRGRPDVYYAHLAAACEILCDAGSEHPVDELAKYINALIDVRNRE